VIEIAGTMDDTVNLHRGSAHPVEYKVGFQHEDPIPRAPESGIARDSPDMRVTAKPTDSAIELFHKSMGPFRTVLRYEIQHAQQIVLGRRQVAN